LDEVGVLRRERLEALAGLAVLTPVPAPDVLALDGDLGHPPLVHRLDEPAVADLGLARLLLGYDGPQEKAHQEKEKPKPEIAGDGIQPCLSAAKNAHAIVTHGPPSGNVQRAVARLIPARTRPRRRGWWQRRSRRMRPGRHRPPTAPPRRPPGRRYRDEPRAAPWSRPGRPAASACRPQGCAGGRPAQASGRRAA